MAAHAPQKMGARSPMIDEQPLCPCIFTVPEKCRYRFRARGFNMHAPARRDHASAQNPIGARLTRTLALFGPASLRDKIRVGGHMFGHPAVAKPHFVEHVGNYRRIDRMGGGLLLFRHDSLT